MDVFVSDEITCFITFLLIFIALVITVKGSRRVGRPV